MEFENQLRATRTGKVLDQAQLEKVAAVAESHFIEKGMQFCTADQVLDRLFIVTKGCLKGVLTTASNFRTAGYINSGETIGAFSLFFDEPTSVTLVAEYDTHLLSISRELFIELIGESSEFRQLIASTYSHRIRDVLTGNKLRRFARVVVFVLTENQNRNIPREIVEFLADRGEHVAVVSNMTMNWRNVQSFDLDEESLDEIWNHTRSSEIDRVIFVVNAEFASQRIELIEKADEVLWFFYPDQHQQIYDIATQIIVESPVDTAKLKRICLLKDGQLVAPHGISDPRLHKRDFIMPREPGGSSTRLYEQGVSRIAHHLCDIKLGLSLAGGGARGLVHFGVLQTFDREKIYFDMMSGTSAGAMFGLSYASGQEIDFLIDAYTRELTPGFPFSWMPDPNRSFLIWKYRTRGWDAMLRRFFDANIEQLQIPFSAIAVDLVRGKAIANESGDMIRAMLESLNLPGIAAPILRDGMALVDGGVLNNLPADVLVKKNADFVVGINVSSGLAEEFGKNVPGMTTQQMKRVGNLESLFRVLEVMGTGTADAKRHDVDVMVSPDTSKYSFTDFTRGNELAEIGAAVAETCLPEIKESIAKLVKFR